MVIESHPRQLKNKEIRLPHFRDLKLFVSLSSGSFAKYVINWGDGITDTIDHSSYKYPAPFETTHQYERFKYSPYNLEIKTCNEFSCTSTDIKVNVDECGPPFLKIDPKDVQPFMKDKENLILIPWHDPLKQCKNQPESFFDFHISALTVINQGLNRPTKSIDARVDFTKSNLQILIKSYTFDAGSIIINVTMNSQITEDFYQIPLTILPVALRPRISGGAHRVVQRLSYDEVTKKTTFTILRLNLTGNQEKC